ncbi:MAG TPA: DUF1634 domain-containing protein [Terriglobales bacterium]|nr:DUF1634 domain-containing protein [Terriglobales bacterium]
MLRNWSDRKIEEIVGDILRAGVTVSAVVVFAGGLLYLKGSAWTHPDYRVFHGEPSDLRALGGIWHGALALDARAIIQLGLLLLIATPVLRVMVAILGFAAERDRMYVIFTSIVLTILLYSLFGSGSAF